MCQFILELERVAKNFCKRENELVREVEKKVGGKSDGPSWAGWEGVKKWFEGWARRICKELMDEYYDEWKAEEETRYEEEERRKREAYERWVMEKYTMWIKEQYLRWEEEEHERWVQEQYERWLLEEYELWLLEERERRLELQYGLWAEEQYAQLEAYQQWEDYNTWEEDMYCWNHDCLGVWEETGTLEYEEWCEGCGHWEYVGVCEGGPGQAYVVREQHAQLKVFVIRKMFGAQ